MECASKPIQIKPWSTLLPKTSADRLGYDFLCYLELRGLSRNTIIAYGRSIESFITTFGSIENLTFDLLIVQKFLATLKNTFSRQHGTKAAPLSRSTIAQRLVAIRSFADYLVDRGILKQNPIPMGSIRRTPEGEVVRIRHGILAIPKRYPRIPTDEEWRRLLLAVQGHQLRDRLMFALAYDGALRRNELVTLALTDFDFSARLISIREENSKNGRPRKIPYSETTGSLLRGYLSLRRALSPKTSALFVSTSPRNRGLALSGYTWGLVAESLKRQSHLHFFSTHTLRHLRLTDLARAGLDLKEISEFAGHRSIDSTMIYIHLSGRDLARAFDRVSRHMVNRLYSLSPSEQ